MCHRLRAAGRAAGRVAESSGLESSQPTIAVIGAVLAAGSACVDTLDAAPLSSPSAPTQPGGSVASVDIGQMGGGCSLAPYYRVPEAALCVGGNGCSSSQNRPGRSAGNAHKPTTPNSEGVLLATSARCWTTFRTNACGRQRRVDPAHGSRHLRLLLVVDMQASVRGDVWSMPANRFSPSQARAGPARVQTESVAEGDAHQPVSSRPMHLSIRALSDAF